MAANPPGPGLLEHEPSVQMLTAFMSSSFGLQASSGLLTLADSLLLDGVRSVASPLTRYIVFMVRSRLAIAAWASGLRANCV